MGAVRARARGPFGHGVLEALDAVLAPGLRDRVLDLAMQISAGEGVPEEAERARDFVEGPLRTAVQRLVGEEAAQFVIDRLDPLLVMGGSQVRPSRPAAAVDPDAIPTAPPPAIPRLLIATLDRGVARLLGERIGLEASASRVSDIFELVSRLDTSPAGRTVVVLDCRSASIDPSALLGIRRAAADRCALVIWGASEQVRRRLTDGRPETDDWIFTPAGFALADLAQLVRSLL